MSLWRELKRRNVFRVAAAYAVVAWLLIQAADIMLTNFGAPDWVFKSLVVVIVVGFPFALFLAWAYELTPEGVKRDEDARLGGSVAPRGGRKLDFLIIGVLVVAVGWFAWDKFRTAPTPTQAPAARAASIAVLPFADMSAEGDQAYFADGLSEEILNLLAGIRELKVTGRTSSFAFKGKDAPIPEIGRTLGVAHVLEGSVRKAGERVRITAQLVETDTGFHLWSESFDRRLEDVFVIQDEIAGAIAEALRVTLVGQAGAGPGDFSAYDLLLRARALVYERTSGSLLQARSLIDRALELDPDYAPALAASGESWLLLSDDPASYGDVPAHEAHAAARADLQRALARDPDLAEAHAAMGLLLMNLGDYAAAQARLARALEINPSLTNANHWHALSLSRGGRVREAVAAAQRFAELDPLFMPNVSNLIIYLAEMGEFDAAEQQAKKLQRQFPDHGYSYTTDAFRLLFLGRLADAAGSVERATAIRDGGSLNRWVSEVVRYSLGDYETMLEHSIGWAAARALIALGRIDEGLERARRRVEESPANFSAAWGLLHGLAQAGRHEELLDWAAGRWGSAAALDAEFSHDFALGGTLMPLAAAQRAAGSESDLAATLEHWGETQAMLEENGHASSIFRFHQAAWHALSGRREEALAGLARAIDEGYRDPLLARAPAFAELHGDPAFQAQAARNLALINAEREILGMEPLP